MITVTLDAQQFIKQLSDAEQRQIPFATMKALNATGIDVQQAEQSGLGQKFTLRRPDFIRRTVKIERDGFATKDNLRTIVGIDPTRNILAKFEAGGEKFPRDGGASIAIPVDARRSKTDIVTTANRPKSYQLQDLRSTAGGRVAKGNRRTFLIRDANGRGGIFQRVGKGKNSRVKELFAFKPQVPIPKKLDFVATAHRVAAQRWPVNFAMWLERALKTAR